MNLKMVFLFLLMAFMLTSCNTLPSPLEKQVGECLPPVASASDLGRVSFEGPRDIPPSSEWEAIASLPDAFYAQSILHTDNEIWMTLDDIYVYHTDTGELKAYSPNDSFERYLLQTRDGTIWLFSDIVAGHSAVSRYDRSSDQFVDVIDRDGVLMNSVMLNMLTAGVEEDEQGNLWFFRHSIVNRDIALYRLDPSSLRIERHDFKSVKSYINGQAISAEFLSSYRPGYGDIAIDADGKVWYSDNYNGVLLRHDPITGALLLLADKVFLPESGVKGIGFGGGELYLDREDRLWVDDRGWLDISQPDQPVWHPIKRSTLFMRVARVPDPTYLWNHAQVVYQSSNELIWFRAPAGTAVYDPGTDDWCLFTTQNGAVIEDDHGNLWLMAGGKLYRRPVIKWPQDGS